jgi:hypothetical protein
MIREGMEAPKTGETQRGGTRCLAADSSSSEAETKNRFLGYSYAEA